MNAWLLPDCTESGSIGAQNVQHLEICWRLNGVLSPGGNVRLVNSCEWLLQPVQDYKPIPLPLPLELEGQIFTKPKVLACLQGGQYDPQLPIYKNIRPYLWNLNNGGPLRSPWDLAPSALPQTDSTMNSDSSLTNPKRDCILRWCLPYSQLSSFTCFTRVQKISKMIWMAIIHLPGETWSEALTFVQSAGTLYGKCHLNTFCSSFEGITVRVICTVISTGCQFSVYPTWLVMKTEPKPTTLNFWHINASCSTFLQCGNTLKVDAINSRSLMISNKIKWWKRI